MLISSPRHFSPFARLIHSSPLLSSLSKLQDRSDAFKQIAMASRLLTQLAAKAKQASQFLASSASQYYQDMMVKNGKYVAHPPTVDKCQELSRQLFYTRLASMPARYESFWKDVDGLKQLLKTKRELKVEEAGIAVLFGAELYLWFTAGEIVGRGFAITGYKV